MPPPGAHARELKAERWSFGGLGLGGAREDPLSEAAEAQSALVEPCTRAVRTRSLARDHSDSDMVALSLHTGCAHQFAGNSRQGQLTLLSAYSAHAP